MAAVDRELGRLEDAVSANPDSLALALPRDAVVITFARDRVVPRPKGRLVFYPSGNEPASDALEQLSDDPFRAGERLEFEQHDYQGAQRAFRRLTQSRDAAVRAGALMRLARNLKKAGEPRLALAAYGDLARIDGVEIAGDPADLIAREARCSLLAEQRDMHALQREALELRDALARGRWRLDRASYVLHTDRVRQWLPTNDEMDSGDESRLALAGTVERLWTDWQRTRREEPGGRLRQNSSIDGASMSIIGRSWGDSLTALVASTRAVESWVRATIDRARVSVALVDSDGRVVSGSAAAGAPFVARAAQDTRLPWTLRVASANSQADHAQLAARRRLLLLGLAVTALLTTLGGYFTARATARELAVARLESDFVSAVSHEFRTPLTSLRHLTELLESGTGMTEDRRRQYYAVMSRETERLHRLVERLLDFGRMEAGRRDYSFDSVDPVALVEDVVGEFRADLAQSPGRSVETVAPADASVYQPVRADRDAMGLVIRNLLDNAVKYSPAASRVRVELDQVGDRVAIRVRDEGVGIPADERDAIFEKFVRGSASRQLSVKGTGVGLAMVRHVVRAHGGEIRVESEPGRGSTFTVLLPRGSADQVVVPA